MKLYRDALIQTVESWNSSQIEDEWVFEKFRSAFVERMTPLEAFSVLNETIEFLMYEDDESTACELLQTIINLAKKSGTTELPINLEKNKNLIERQFLLRGEYSQSKLKELFRYYRWSL